MKVKESDHPNDDQIVVLIHGLLRTHRSMNSLSRYLQKKGYTVHKYSYRSTRSNIKEHGIELKKTILQLIQENPGKKINFITHSLGGIIAREAISLLSPVELQHCHYLIMLAPPNHGSKLAKLIVNMMPFPTKWIKPLAELSSSQDAYVHHIAIPTTLKMGIIAGRFDAKVSLASARLKGLNEFVIVNATHTFIMDHFKARLAILHFLAHGSFSK